VNVSKGLRFSFIPISAVFVVAGLILTALPASAANEYQFKNNGSQLCLDSNSSGQSDLNGCDFLSTELWIVIAHITLTNPLTGKPATYNQWSSDGKCLGLAGGTGPQLVIGACSSTSDHSQFWWGPTISNSNYSAMINGHTGKCVGTNGSGTSVGTLVIEGTCTVGPTQQWQAVFVN
jgi:hypothetical protein